MPYVSEFSTRRTVEAPNPKRYPPYVKTDLRGLDLTSPYDQITNNRTPYAKNFRLYAESEDDRRVAVSSRKGSGFYTTPLSEATIDTQTSATGQADKNIGILTEWKAEKFTASATGAMTMLELRVKNPGTATGSLIITVHEDNAGQPGDEIGRGGIPGNLITSSYAYVGARLIQAPRVTSATDYWFVVHMQDDGSGFYQIDSTTSVTTALTSDSAGSGWDSTTYGVLFKAYGASDVSIKGMARFAPSDAQNKTLVAIGNNIYTVNDGTGALTSIVSGLDASASHVYFTKMDDKIFFVNGFDDLKSWDGTTVETITHAQLPILTFVIAYKERLWGISADDPNRIVFSEVPGNDDGAGNEWYEAWLSTNFRYVPSPKAADPITAIVPFQDSLVIFTKSSKYILYGSDKGSFTLRESVGKKGAVSQWGTIADENFIWFVSDDGFYRFNGSSDDLITDMTEDGGGSVQPEYDGIADLNDVSVVKWRRQIRFYYRSSGASQNNRCLIFHTIWQEWLMDTDNYVSFAVAFNDGNDDGRLIEASSVAPVVYQAEVDDNNLGGEIDFEYHCNYDSFGNPAMRKRIVKLFPLVEGENRDYPIQIGIDRDLQNDPRITDQNIAVGGLVIGDFLIGNDVVIGGATTYKPKRMRVSGHGYYWQLRIKRRGINNPVQFLGYVVSIRSKRL